MSTPGTLQASEFRHMATEVAGWLWGTVQGAWNEKQTVSQIITDAVIGMIPLVGQATAAPPPVLVERYRLGEHVLAVIAMVSHLASPGEIELGLLRIESFVPADIESERILTRR